MRDYTLMISSMNKAIISSYKAVVLAGATIALFGASYVLAASTVVVTGDTSAGENQPGWMFNRDAGTATPYEFNENAASLGSGSVYVLPVGANPADKFIAENFVNTPIANVNSISYDFLIGSGGDASDENEFYMNVYANFGESADDKFYDCRYSIVPTTGSTGSFTTVTFDPSQSYPVTTRGGASASPYPCPAKPADMDLSSPGSNIRVFALNLGDTTANDQGLDGHFDNVVVDLDSGVTIYDFEAPVPNPESLADCKKNGWKKYQFKNQGQCIVYVTTGKDSRNPNFGISFDLFGKTYKVNPLGTKLKEIIYQ
jgi:hypothetical protein